MYVCMYVCIYIYIYIYIYTSAERERVLRAGCYEQTGRHTTIRTHVEKHTRRLAAAQAPAYCVFVFNIFSSRRRRNANAQCSTVRQPVERNAPRCDARRQQPDRAVPVALRGGERGLQQVAANAKCSAVRQRVESNAPRCDARRQQQHDIKLCQ